MAMAYKIGKIPTGIMFTIASYYCITVYVRMRVAQSHGTLVSLEIYQLISVLERKL